MVNPTWGSDMLIFFQNWASKYAYPYAYFSAIFIKICACGAMLYFIKIFFQSEPRQYAYQFEQYAYFFLKTSLGYAYKWYAYEKKHVVVKQKGAQLISSWQYI